VAYQNYAGAWLNQSNGAYDWLANPGQPVSLSAGVDTVKIWQSYTLPDTVNNLIIFGDHNYAAGNNQDNVIKAEAPGDLIYGGRGDDVFIGSGTGTTFIVAQGEGDKVIQNFTEGADTLRLIGGSLTSFAAVKAAMTQQGSDVVLNDGGAMIAFRNATVSQFQATDFQLPMNPASLGAVTYSEDFNDPATIAANFTTNYGYAGTGLNSFTLPNNAEQQIYTSPSFQGTSNAPLGLNPFSFSNGVLTISAQPVTAAQSAQMWGYHYSSGLLESNSTQTYGYFEMRAELPHGQGLWPAFWLLGSDNKEIDVLEGLGSDTKTANNAVHSNAVPALGNASFNPYASGFHTYGVLWDPQHVTYYIDGAPVWQTATPADMNSPMRMVVNLAVGGNWPGSPDATTPFPAQLRIDYIHAYALPNAGPPPGGNGGGGNPPPPSNPPPGNAGVVLTATSPGATLVGTAGADTLNASQGSDHLTGGGGADTFAYRALPWSAGHVTDFQVGVDKLDISALYTNGYAGADPVSDGYVSFASDGAGGAKVMLDPDGPAGANTIKFVVADLDGISPTGLTAANVFGASGAGSPPPSNPPPGNAGVVLTATSPGATLVGTAGADTLNASQGSDHLTGGAGADHFAFAHLPWSAGHVTDFTPGSDVLDLRALFAAIGYHGADPVADGTLSFVSDGAGDTRVMFKDPGSPWPTLVTTLDHVDPGSVHSGDWLFH
jgi:serralysin